MISANLRVFVGAPIRPGKESQAGVGLHRYCTDKSFGAEESVQPENQAPSTFPLFSAPKHRKEYSKFSNRKNIFSVGLKRQKTFLNRKCVWNRCNRFFGAEVVFRIKIMGLRCTDFCTDKFLSVQDR